MHFEKKKKKKREDLLHANFLVLSLAKIIIYGTTLKVDVPKTLGSIC